MKSATSAASSRALLTKTPSYQYRAANVLPWSLTELDQAVRPPKRMDQSVPPTVKLQKQKSVKTHELHPPIYAEAHNRKCCKMQREGGEEEPMPWREIKLYTGHEDKERERGIPRRSEKRLKVGGWYFARLQ